MQSIGVKEAQAKTIFILPTAPKGHYFLNDDHCLSPVSVADIIVQDGNHWRKILTIMAKLSIKQGDWRHYRDELLLNQYERIEFALPRYFNKDVMYFVCGKEMQSALDEEFQTITYLNEKHTLGVYKNVVLCPYLDYRQYSNKDIDVTRLYLQS